MTKLTDLVIGTSGVGAIELVSSPDLVNLSQVSDVTSVIVQIIIGVVTLLGLFRKKQKI